MYCSVSKCRSTKRVGSRAQVMHGNAKMTGGGLKKKDLKYNKHGKIVSKKMSTIAKKKKRLQKAGWGTKKGQVGAMQIRGGANAVSDSTAGSTPRPNEINKYTLLDYDKFKWYKNPISISWDGTKSFKEIKSFFYHNIGKIVINFDGTPEGNNLIKLFIGKTFTGDKKSRQTLIKDFLFSDNSAPPFNIPNDFFEINYYICKKENNVVFYDVENLDLLLSSLKNNKIDYKKDELLELTCTWIRDNKAQKKEYELIKILFGSTDICGWQSVNKDKLYNVSDMEPDIQTAYINFICESIKTAQKKVEKYRTELLLLNRSIKLKQYEKKSIEVLKQNLAYIHAKSIFWRIRAELTKRKILNIVSYNFAHWNLIYKKHI
jgi:hypothetical protein